jgi:hypothetical protein
MTEMRGIQSSGSISNLRKLRKNLTKFSALFARVSIRGYWRASTASLSRLEIVRFGGYNCHRQDRLQPSMASQNSFTYADTFTTVRASKKRHAKQTRKPVSPSVSLQRVKAELESDTEWMNQCLRPSKVQNLGSANKIIILLLSDLHRTRG